MAGGISFYYEGVGMTLVDYGRGELWLHSETGLTEKLGVNWCIEQAASSLRGSGGAAGSTER